jgi:hypothetical protein
MQGVIWIREIYGWIGFEKSEANGCFWMFLIQWELGVKNWVCSVRFFVFFGK